MRNEKPQICYARECDVRNLEMTEGRRHYLRFEKQPCCNWYGGIYEIIHKARPQLLQSVLADVFTRSAQGDGRQQWAKTCFRVAEWVVTFAQNTAEGSLAQVKPMGDCTWSEPARISVKLQPGLVCSPHLSPLRWLAGPPPLYMHFHMWHWKPVQHVTALSLN